MCRPKDLGGLGFRKMEMVNNLFMVKWAWKVLTDSPSLWVGLVKAKYLRGRNFSSLEAKAQDSWVWKAILKGRNLVTKGACLTVGVNSCIDIWTEPWVPFLEIFIPQPLNESQRNNRLSVTDLMNTSGGWNTNRLKEIFNLESVKAILKIPLSADNQARTKKWFWALSSNGNFSVHSLYQKVIRGLSPSNDRTTF